MGSCGTSKMKSNVEPCVSYTDGMDETNKRIMRIFKMDGMDEANKRIMMIFKTQGEDAGLKALMTREDGTEMTYAESRAKYG